MSDTLLVRFVDDQCAQVNWLLRHDDDSMLARRSILHAACAMAEQALIGYFAEQTQKRYNADVWRGFLTVGASFEALALHAKQSGNVLAHWRQLEQDDDSSFALVLRAIAQCKVPNSLSYKSSLLNATTLSSEETNAITLGAKTIATPAPLIASTSHVPAVTLASFKTAWHALMLHIQQDRQLTLEC